MAPRKRSGVFIPSGYTRRGCHLCSQSSVLTRHQICQSPHNRILIFKNLWERSFRCAIASPSVASCLDSPDRYNGLRRTAAWIPHRVTYTSRGIPFVNAIYMFLCIRGKANFTLGKKVSHPLRKLRGPFGPASQICPFLSLTGGTSLLLSPCTALNLAKRAAWIMCLLFLTKTNRATLYSCLAKALSGCRWFLVGVIIWREGIHICVHHHICIHMLFVAGFLEQTSRLLATFGLLT